MKQQIIEKNNINVLHKIEIIEKELSNLKLVILKNMPSKNKKIISLKGIIKGVDVTDEEINNAQKNIYDKIGV
ncbi:hypothetical protein HY745_03345 [Candidatus Desantisbacteria bacterium]|nr:hypothetical protein [Candidatus Desantisbacteria bacterium]